MIHNSQSAQISLEQDGCNIYVVMKTICPPGYHYNGFVATNAHWYMMHGYTLLVSLNVKIVEQAKQGCKFLLQWYQQCVTVQHVPKCMSCNKAQSHGGDNQEGTLFSLLYICMYIYI